MTNTLTLSLSLITIGVLLGGCSAPVEQQQSTTAGAQSARQAAPAPATNAGPPVSINALMVGWIDHASHALWDVEKDGKAPKTEADWMTIEHHAIQLAGAGALVALGGTGVHDNTYREKPDWAKWSRAMSDAGLAALKASREKNLTALVAANNQLVESCQSCHDAFKPDLPSEGIHHPHAH